MGEEQRTSGAGPTVSSRFWDALAPYHSAIENNYLDLPSVHRLMQDLRDPVLIVGAGLGLIVAELRKRGFQCDGVDLSSEMVRHAKLRRGIALIHADARTIPVPDRRYGTVIYATGVVDFTADEEEIREMLNEGRRMVQDSGGIFVAFYRLSAAQESFLEKVGLLRNHLVAFRKSLELYLLNPVQMITWVARRADVGYLRAAFWMVRLSVRSTMREKRTTLRMQKIVRSMNDPNEFINAAAEQQPYRNAAEIRNLFGRLGIPVAQLHALASCFVVQVQ